MPTPICVKCRVAMRCGQNDFIVRDSADGGFPSTYWAGDKFYCPQCGHEVVVGFGKPVQAEKASQLGWTEQAMEFGHERRVPQG
jgi:hypothetical protein